MALAVLGIFAMPQQADAQNYRFDNIKVEGNQRIETSTIIAYTGIKRGESVSGGRLNDAYQTIAGSGVFESVDLDPRGNTLVIKVKEFPTINSINFEGNKRIKDDALGNLIESSPRRVFNPAQAERDAAIIAEAYSQQGRISSRVTPRIIRRSENRVDLVFEIAEGSPTEVERISFVGNRAYSDRRLRRVLETKQASILRTFVRSDTLIEDRVEFDKQVMRDFYLSRGYVDFRVHSANAELTRRQDGVYLTFNIQEGQQFKFGQITTSSEIPNVDADEFHRALKVKSGVIYSPTLIENSIARQERLALRKGINFLRVEPRITRNDRDLTLDVEFVLSRGPRVFVERIDIEGNTTTVDRVIRQQFKIAEGDPFNPREIRESAERIRALGFFADAKVDAREGSSPNQVVIDVDVEEQPTGRISLGGSFSTNSGFGLALGLTENNFLGRGQRLSFGLSTAEDSEEYAIGFTEPFLLGRDLQFDFDARYAESDSSFYSYNTESLRVSPALTFPVSDNGRLQLRYAWDDRDMLERSTPSHGNVIGNEIAQGSQVASTFGVRYFYDSRNTGLNPNAGYRFEVGADYAGIGGDSEFISGTAKAIAQTRILNEEVTLRATLEGGALSWRGDGYSRSIDRYNLNPDILRGFEPGGIGPRDFSNGRDDPIGGNYYAVARLEAQFPLGLPEEVGVRGALFFDIGNLWNLDNVDTTGGTIVGEEGSWRQVVGVSVLWNTGIGPLRFDFTNAINKEDFDLEQSFNFTLQTQF